MGRLFGTDGIRGPANVEPIGPEMFLQLGLALGEIVRRREPRVVVGRDTRLSGTMLEAALVAGLCSAGASVEIAGVVPTPAVAALTIARGAGAGAVISASHNPFSDNGIKFFGPDGFKLSDAEEAEIEVRVLDSIGLAARPAGAEVGTATISADAVEVYVASLLHSIDDVGALRGMRVVVDCANGAAATVVPRLCERIELDATLIAATPDGLNINRDCGALHAGALRRAVVESGALVGIALDGDADRLVLVDDQGVELDGDDILAILAQDFVARRALRVPTIVGTVMSNLGLELALHTHGIQLARTAVGDRHVVEEMRRSGAQLGGESSGHIVLLDHATTGDGLLAALNVLAVMARTNLSLRDLRRGMTKCPQSLVNVRVVRRVDLKSVESVRLTIEEVEAALHKRGRVLVRYSGTEPLVRVMVEGDDAREVEACARRIAAVIETSVV